MSHPPHPLATVAQVVETPSMAAGLPREVENDLRVAGCMLIQEAGVMLNLPQSTMATAQVLFHRFYYVSSMLSFSVNDIAISSLYLSSKLNETPVRLRDLINTFIYLQARIKHLLSLDADYVFSDHVAEKGDGWRIGMEGRKGVWERFTFEVPGFHDEVFWDWKDVIVASEMQILKRLGFNMQVDLPYSHVINYCKILDLVFEPDVAQTAWSILNDALLTPLYAIHPPHVLAVSSIYLTTRLTRIPLPEDWYILFDASLDEITSCAGTIMRLYNDWAVRPPGGLDRTAEEVWQAGKRGREGRWRRAWILAESRKAIRKWVDERAR